VEKFTRIAEISDVTVTADVQKILPGGMLYNICMPISRKFQGRKVYHFTPFSNLPMILAHGLLSPDEQKRLGLPLRTIVWEAVQRHRAGVTIPVEPGGTPEAYIPFYFCKLSPMLLTIMDFPRNSGHKPRENGVQ
jgi:hypothetical protein